MTRAARNPSESTSELTAKIKPVVIEVARQYMDSQNLVTKDYLNERLIESEKRLSDQIAYTKENLNDRFNHFEKLFTERLGNTEKFFAERLTHTENLLIEKQNSLLLRFVLILIPVIGLTLGGVRLMYPPATAAAQAVQPLPPSSMTR